MCSLSHTSARTASALRGTRMHSQARIGTVHAIHYQLHAHTCKRPQAHLNADIWMHAYMHAFMNAFAVAIKRMQSHI